MSKEILKPTNDYVFAKLFGKKGNEDITRDFIEKVTGIRYDDINLEGTPILDRSFLEDKKGILDVKVVANKYNNIDIEMQVVKSKYIADRILWYWAKMYSASIDKGETYDATKRAVCILIADFKLDNLYDIPKFNTKWQIREEEYKNIVLTNKLELYIIELTKLEENIGKTDNVGLINWCKFIKNPEEVSDSIMKENEYIKKAKEELDEISQSDYDRRMAELREKAILDELMFRKSGYEEGKEEGRADGIKEGRKEGIKEGRKEGRKEGIKEGIEEGRTKEKENIAKIMLKKKIDIKTICEITGLAEEEIRKL